MRRATSSGPKQPPTEGDPKIIIDLLTQTAYAYRGDVLVGAASVSSAKTGKVTPLGFWKVLEKRKAYRSKKYNNASMPFMQRIDEYGIALHGGVNPGFPGEPGLRAHADEVRGEAVRADEDRH